MSPLKAFESVQGLKISTNWESSSSDTLEGSVGDSVRNAIKDPKKQLV